MPQDKHGRPLKPGDRVVVPCVVKEVQSSADYCNCTLETEEATHPGGLKSTFVLSTSQVFISAADEGTADSPPPDIPPGSGD